MDINNLRFLENKANIDPNIFVGMFYEHGFLFPKNMSYALKIYKKLSDNGDSSGDYALALMYEYGNVVEKNFHVAFDLYNRSYNKGFALAKYALGRYYDFGSSGSPVNY